MKFTLIGPLILALACLNLWAREEAVDPAPPPETALAPQSHLSGDGIYIFSEDVELVPVQTMSGDKIANNNSDQAFTFSKGEAVAIEHQASGDVALTLLPSKDETGVPERLLLKSWQFDGAALKFSAQGKASELKAKYSAEQSSIVASLGGGYAGSRHHLGGKSRAGRGIGRMHWRGATGCVASVLSSIGWTGPQANGVGITRVLKDAGWHNVSCGRPPVGAVASWSGGSGAGHTARWNGQCWKYDIACDSDTHGPGSNYHLKECVAH